MSESKYVPNPIMDINTNDLKNLVQWYNLIEEIPKNKKFEWEDNGAIEENCGWCKIDSVDHLREFIIHKWNLENKLYSYTGDYLSKRENLLKIITDNDDFLNEIKNMFVGFNEQFAFRYNGKSYPIQRLAPLNSSNFREYFNTTDEILSFFREKSKTDDIMLTCIQTVLQNSTVQHNFMVRFHIVELAFPI